LGKLDSNDKYVCNRSIWYVKKFVLFLKNPSANILDAGPISTISAGLIKNDASAADDDAGDD
jgi:hypothetical protein